MLLFCTSAPTTRIEHKNSRLIVSVLCHDLLYHALCLNGVLLDWVLMSCRPVVNVSRMTKTPPHRRGITFEVGAQLEARDSLKNW